MTFYVSQETVSAWMTAFKPSSAISGHNPKASGSLEPKNSKTEAAVSVPGTFDVLLGRGKSNQNRPGNARYKVLIEMYREKYSNALNRKAKRAITKVIFEAVMGKGRFLKRANTGGGPKRATTFTSWIELSVEEALLKIAHALQYRRRCSLQLLQQQQADCRKEEQDKETGKEDEPTTSTEPSYSGATIVSQSITFSEDEDEEEEEKQQQQQQACCLSSAEEEQHHLDQDTEASSKPESEVSSVTMDSPDDKPDDRHDDLLSIGFESLADILSCVMDHDPGADIDSECGLAEAASAYKHHQEQQALADAQRQFLSPVLHSIAAQEAPISWSSIMEFIDVPDCGTNYFDNCWDEDNDEW